MDPTGLTILGLSAGSGAGAAKFLLEKLLGPSLEAAGDGLVPTGLAAWKERRVKRAAAMLEGASRQLEEAGIEPVPVPGAILWPILEKGSLNEDPSLHDKWVALLANAARGGGKDVPPAFPSILSELTELDASILQALYDEDLHFRATVDIDTKMFPLSRIAERLKRPQGARLRELILPFLNLERMNLIVGSHHPFATVELLSLVVSPLAVLPAMRVGGVEQRDASIKSRVEHRDGPRVITVTLGREAHTAAGEGRICQGAKVTLSLAPCSSKAPEGRSIPTTPSSSGLA